MMAAAVAAAMPLTACMTNMDLAPQPHPREIAVTADALPTGVDSESLAASVPALIARTAPSYVTLVVRQPRKTSRVDAGISRGVSSGSGFVVDAAGHVMTAAHVAVGPDYRVSARAADGRIHEGRVVATHPENDLGLIRLREAVGRPVTPAASPCLKPGDMVFSLGRPRGGQDTARIGVVKAMHFNRQVRYGRYGYPDAMILRMATRRGESGGPVFNARGELVGMVVSTLSANGRPLNLAHAIPLPPIARFYCSRNPDCGARWRKLAQMDTNSCR